MYRCIGEGVLKRGKTQAGWFPLVLLVDAFRAERTPYAISEKNFVVGMAIVSRKVVMRGKNRNREACKQIEHAAAGESKDQSTLSSCHRRPLSPSLALANVSPSQRLFPSSTGLILPELIDELDPIVHSSASVFLL